jgi:peptidoglycan/LPS O-acetylase OafA/YrhL
MFIRSYEGSASKIPFLDGARGLAALLVLFSHVFTGCFQQVITAAGIKAAGHSGVELFFVLSGFLIGTQFWKNSTGGSMFSFRDYFARRALRVLPLFYVSFALFFLLYSIEFRNDVSKSIFVIVPFYIFQLQNLFADVNLINPPTWTVAVEIHFYIFLALFFFVLRKHGTKGLLSGIAILFMAVVLYRYWAYTRILTANDYRNLVYANTLARMDHFFIGVILAFVFQRKWMMEKCEAMAPLFFLAGLLLHISLVYVEYGVADISFFSVNLVGILTSLAWGLILFSGLLGFKTVRSIFSIRPLRFCGDISYSIYLLHLPLYTFLFKPLFEKAALHNDFLCGLLFIPCMITVGTLSYLYIEKPFLQLKEKFGPANRKMLSLDAPVLNRVLQFIWVKK